MSDSPQIDWMTRTPEERLAEGERLRRERHGDTLDSPMAVVCRIVDMKTGDVRAVFGDGSPRVQR